MLHRCRDGKSSSEEEQRSREGSYESVRITRAHRKVKLCQSAEKRGKHTPSSGHRPARRTVVLLLLWKNEHAHRESLKD